jgi:hypothetical protein
MARSIGTCGTFGEPHDLIVGQASQVGNIINSSPYPYLDPNNPALHGTIHKEQRIRNKARDLLNTNILDGAVFAPTIPPRGLGGQPLPPVFTPVSGVSIKVPAPGAVFSSGGAIPVVLALSKAFKPDRILVFSTFDSQEVDPAVLETTLAIPASAIGPNPVVALAVDAGQNLATVDIVVQIVPPATLTGLSITPIIVELDDLGTTQAMTVTGHFSDDVDRDMTHAALGTMYESSDETIAIVTGNGIVSSARIGACTITAMNGGFEATAEVEVVDLPCPGDVNWDEAVNTGDLLMVLASYGPCYACGADIDLNGVVNVSDLLIVLGGWGPCPGP